MSFTPNSNICEPAEPITTDWKSIKWNKVNRHVTSLQRRIYRASRNKDKKKVRDLQRQLMRSNSALLSAIKRATQINKGKYTPGIDGLKVTSDKARAELYDELRYTKMKLHKPKPTLRKYIPKKNGKLRSLGIPTIKDRIYQEIIRMALEPEWEATFEPTSYGFRPKRRQHDAIKRIYYNIKSGKWCWVFEGDFKSCFDTLSHEFILKQIRDFPHYNLVKRFLKAGYYDNGTYYKEYSSQITTRGKYRFCRYADDFLIFAQTKEDIEKVPELLENYLSERGLILSKEKTKITHLSKGFNFLGFNFKQDKDGVSRIRPSKDSQMKFKEDIDYIFKSSYGHNVGVLIRRLNPLIRGTANYWRYGINGIRELSKMDHHIVMKTLNFLKRMHSNKSWKWIINKYFVSHTDGRHKSSWVLRDPISGMTLEIMSWYNPRRYIMIKHDYSPYDGDKKEYFESRKSKFYFST